MFPEYRECRQKFMQAARYCNAKQQSYPISIRDKTDENLYIDVAYYGSEEPEKTIIISSGLHGVEGSIGSAIQVELMKNLDSYAIDISKTSIVFIHSLNPYGFAFRRRVNEDNIDLNRNFSFDEDNPNNMYDLMENFLNPKIIRRYTTGPGYYLNLLKLAFKYDIKSIRQAIAGGQRKYKNGIFYGGTLTSRSTQIVKSNIHSWTRGARKVFHLDLHSGLGKRGCVTLLFDDYPEKIFYRIKDYLHPFKVKGHDQDSGVYQANGTMGQWCRLNSTNEAYIFACAELGTLNPISILKSLRIENYYHNHGIVKSKPWIKSKEKLLKAFFPRSEKWKKTATNSGVTLVRKIINLSDDIYSSGYWNEA